jgi:hypothetical protein
VYGEAENYPMPGKVTSSHGLTVALDDHEKAVEALQALADELVLKLETVLRPCPR